MHAKRWLQLDGIRGIAILAVLLFHLSYEQVLSGGFLGVDLFFALSGFLITTLLLSELTRKQRINLRFFYTRRVLRLYPALVVSVIAACFFWWPDRWSQLKMTLAVLTYGSNFWGGFTSPRINILGFTWSLSIEEQFYLLWPMLLSFVYLRVARFVTISFMLLCIFGAAATRFYMLRHGYPEIVIYVNTFTRMDAIFTGSLGAVLLHLYEEGTRRVPGQRALNLALWPASLCFAVFLQYGSRNLWMLHWGFTVIAFLCTVFITGSTFLAEKSLLYKVLTIPPMLYLGRRSYGIYVYHGFILEATESLRVPHSKANLIAVTLLRVGVIFAVVEFSYRLIEMPFLRLKERFEVARPVLLHNA